MSGPTQREKRQERGVALVVKRCQHTLQHVQGIRVGGKIDCGQQGCVYAGKRGEVVKISTAGQMGRAFRPKTKEHDDFTAAAWLANTEWSQGRGKYPPALPQYQRIGTLENCIHEDWKTHRKFRGGPRIAYVTVREDLPDIPARWMPSIEPAIPLLQDLEDAIEVRGAPAINAFLRERQDDIRRLRGVGAHLFKLIVQLQRWLTARGAWLWDLNEGNLGVRHLRGHPVEIVVRDTGGVRPLPRHKRSHRWQLPRLRQKWSSDLGGYDGGP